MALAFSLSTESQAGSGTSDTSASITPTAGSALFILWGGISNDGLTMAGHSSTLTSSAGFTCTKVSDSAAYGGSSSCMAALWKVTNVTATAGTFTFKFSLSAVDRNMALFAQNITQITGQDATNPVVQFVEREDNSFATDVNGGTLASFGSANNATYLGSVSPASSASMTVGSSFTALGSTTARRFAEYRLANVTTPNATDANQGKYACWAVEVKAAVAGGAPAFIAEALGLAALTGLH